MPAGLHVLQRRPAQIVGLLLLVPAVRESLRIWGTNRVAGKWVVIK